MTSIYHSAVSRIFLLTILMVPPFYISAQESTAALSPKNGWHWGITSSVDYCDRVLVVKSDDPIYYISKDLADKEETGLPGYSFGVVASRRFADNLMFRTGLVFSRQGYQYIDKFPSQWPSQNNNGEFDPTLPGEDIHSLNFRYHTYSIGVPINIDISIGDTKKWFFSAGFSTRFFLHENTTFIAIINGIKERSTEKRNVDYAPVNIIPEIGFGKNMVISPRAQLKLAPTFRYGIIPLFSDGLAEYRWSAGLQATLLFTGKSTGS